MNASGTGALPSQTIRTLIEKGHILGCDTSVDIQPSSLDLSLSNTVYRLRSIFLPKANERIEDILDAAGATPYDFSYPFEVGVPYLVKLNESLKLPQDIYAYANPKSSTGRNDICVNMLADHVSRFDSAGIKGYEGALWALIRPRSFPVKFAPGDALLQMRFFNGDTRFTEHEVKPFYEQYTPFFNYKEEPLAYERIKVSDRDGGLILTVDLRNEIVGWRCEAQQNILDFSKINFYNPRDFFRPIMRPDDGMLRLRNGDFYIFYSREWVRVPPDFALEMVPVDIRSGEYRSHYAGFIDPGWGYGRAGEVHGKPLVLEVRPFEDNIILRDNQPVAKIIYERMADMPDVVYGKEIGSHYAEQTGPRLSKHFKNVDQIASLAKEHTRS